VKLINLIKIFTTTTITTIILNHKLTYSISSTLYLNLLSYIKTYDTLWC